MRKPVVSRPGLRTPKAAALAGVIFSVLLITAFWLLRVSVPADPLEPGAWLDAGADTVATALNIVPFAGIAFLWFIAVLRDRLGDEDRFFTTVFFGSALLFLAMLFVAAAIVGAIILTFAVRPTELIDSAIFNLARAAAYNIVNIYMIKMAAVVMVTTSTVAIYTAFAPRWVAFLGYGLALVILLGSYQIAWSFVIFPFWVLVISLYILIDDWQRG